MNHKKLEEDLTLEEFEHRYNSMNLFCRLKERGINDRKAKVFAIRYELQVYRPVMRELEKIKEKDNPLNNNT